MPVGLPIFRLCLPFYTLYVHFILENLTHRHTQHLFVDHRTTLRTFSVHSRNPQWAVELQSKDQLFLRAKKNVLKHLRITYTGTYEGMHRAGGSPAFIWGSQVLAGCFTTKGSACVCVAGAIHFAVCKHRRPTKGCGVAKKPRCPRRMHMVAAHGRHSQFYLCACTGCMALMAPLRDAEGLYKST